MGSAAALVPLVVLGFPSFKKFVRKHKRRAAIISLNEVLNIISIFLITIAASTGYITLVKSVAATQPFFVLLFATIISIFYPKFLKEEISRTTIELKILSTALIFIGFILIVY